MNAARLPLQGDDSEEIKEEDDSVDEGTVISAFGIDAFEVEEHRKHLEREDAVRPVDQSRNGI